MHANRLTLNRVRELRRERSMTQAQLARRAQVALRTIQSIERGLGCRRDTMRKLLRALEVPFDDWRQVFLMTPIPAKPIQVDPPARKAGKKDEKVEVETWSELGRSQESYLDSNA